MTTPYAPLSPPQPQPTDEHRPRHAEHHLLVALLILTTAPISVCLRRLMIRSATVTS